MDSSIEISSVTAHVYRVPIATPVVTSFGEMHSRPAVFVKAESVDGWTGWGEIWCNFPSVGAEHRARLVHSVLKPLIEWRLLENPQTAFSLMSARTDVLAIQSGEPGPLAQAIAGIDMALWDIVARRAGLPLYRVFTAGNVGSLPVYASGLNTKDPDKLAEKRAADGHRRFKLKVGFGRDRDVANLRSLRHRFGSDADIMVDANQAWSLDDALAMRDELAGYAPVWLEEPIRADAPLDAWRRLAQDSPIPLALGENVRGEKAFDRVIDARIAGFLQPDIGKWGGFSATIALAKRAREAGITVCPHWLGGGIGLVASWHYLAAIGGAGILEVDSNDNPLRDELILGYPAIEDGAMRAPDGPGLGVEPDLESLERYSVSVAD